MLVTDNIIYFELQKTASTFTRLVLAEMYADNCTIIGKHNSLKKIPQDVLGDFSRKVKVGNIRNPWDWYVSLWSFGCKKRGGLRYRLINQEELNFLGKKGIRQVLKRRLKLGYPKLDKEIWLSLYSDPYNYKNFNRWLELILTVSKHDLGEGFKAKKMSEFSGLLTYRYLRLYTADHKFYRIGSYEELKSYDKKENFINEMIRKEALLEGLERLAGRLDYQQEKLIRIINQIKSKPNASIRDKDYRKYYTDESISMVEKYEKLIIDKYKYTFE